MDPIMVAGGHWVWDVNGAYHGTPLQNFWGWWLTVFTTFALYLLVSGKASKVPTTAFDRLAVLSYLVTALIGFFAMLPWVITGWLKMGE
jgi:uncharacterized membrane protein